MSDFEIAICDLPAILRLCARNPKLANALAAYHYRWKNKRKRPKAPTALLVRARYGASIVADGRFNWEGIAKGKTAADVSVDLNDYRYSNIPICLVTQNSFEVWTARQALTGIREDRKDTISIPHFVAQPGDFLGLFETLSPLKPPAWNVSSGVQSVFFVPPLGDQRKLRAFFRAHKSFTGPLAIHERGFDRSKVYDCKLEWSDHHRIVGHLLRGCNVSDWSSELLVFSSDFLKFVGFDWIDGSIAVTEPSSVADFFKTQTIGQLADALQVHISVTNDSKNDQFCAERSAARLVAVAKGAAPTFSSVTKGDNDLLPADRLAAMLEITPLHNTEQHHCMLFAAQPLRRSKLGYFSLHIPYAEFDWERKVTSGNLLDIQKQLRESPAYMTSMSRLHVRLLTADGKGVSGELEGLDTAVFMKNASRHSLVQYKRELKATPPRTNPFFSWVVELELRQPDGL